MVRDCWTKSNVTLAPERMQGVNWFGFETSATMVAGLWAGSSSLTQDFKTVVWRFKLLGFNAVRLPFSFKASLAFGHMQGTFNSPSASMTQHHLGL